MLGPVTRRSLPDAVFERICGTIFEGQLAPGDRLPSERELAQQLGVNRNALREALKRLEQLRLVSIHPGGSTRVLDFRRSAGLDLLNALLFSASGALRIEAARSLVELRSALGPDIAGRAAMRATAEDHAALAHSLEEMRAIPVTNLVARQRQSLELWRLLVIASDNLAYRLAFNTMEQAWGTIQDLVAPALRDELEDQAGYERLVRAVQRGNPAASRRAAQRLVSRGEASVLRILALATPKRPARSTPTKEQP
jgi:DNA-binding FadR family transcriptional regulator